jgi:hypothetical protein
MLEIIAAGVTFASALTITIHFYMKAARDKDIFDRTGAEPESSDNSCSIDD